MRDNLPAWAAQLCKVLRKGFEALQTKHQVNNGDIRGRSLLQGVEVVAPESLGMTRPELGAKVADRALELGLSCNIVNLDGFTRVFRIEHFFAVLYEVLAKRPNVMNKAFSNVLSQASPL